MRLVIYDGAPENAEEFLRAYVDDHIPFLQRIPGLTGVRIIKPTETNGPFMLTTLEFESMEAAAAALDSAEMAAARQHAAGLPPFHGHIARYTAAVIARTADEPH
jgi:uncharacterized protein (TIGR02118 family)